MSWPARGPLGRLREARQGPAEAWTAPTKGACPQEDYDLTRVKAVHLKTLRYNTRELTDGERAALIIKGGIGRRLTYRRIDALAA